MDEKVDFHHLVTIKDRNENTILHLAVGDKQVETTEILLSIPRTHFSAVNRSEMTVIEINVRDSEIEEPSKHAGATGGKKYIVPKTSHQNKDNHDFQNTEKQTKNNQKDDWIERKRDALMIVASLVAAMAFQVGVNPPEVVWHSSDQTTNQTAITNSTQPLNNTNTNNQTTIRYNNILQMLSMHNATNATRDYAEYLKTVEGFYITNTMSFIASLTIVLLLMSGLPLRSRFFVWILLVVSWIAISDVALSYACVVTLQTPPEKKTSINTIVGITVIAWTGVLTILLLGHTINLFRILVKKLWFEKLRFGSNQTPSSTIDNQPGNNA